jgi:hypothetical protein
VFADHDFNDNAVVVPGKVVHGDIKRRTMDVQIYNE